jgi:hypothetical protein
MRLALSLIMLLAVVMTLLAPLCLRPANAGSLNDQAMMTLDVCNVGQDDGVAAGLAVFIPQDAVIFMGVSSSALCPGEDASCVLAVFIAGPDRPPRA